ncbi:group I truncated hemoglobin [Permianibacter aggregans]|uniref:Hemoglobin n=1 Tax=Permianibacter aggregans TaxID=1510150 RepID=A0A4R6UKW2_9GAMM|nr:group 1 truncated hemoglobin [Permianibacter aggregans]QGX40575.1 group 1 truncated hemoglobin [Permianibacter aggregans]TDQ43864.1 hemoglobin [Permianibacter aggregans]
MKWVTVIIGLMLAGVGLGDETSLYQRLGGEKGVQTIAERLIDHSSEHPETRRSFDKVDLVKLKQSLATQLCELSEGPCRYQGDDMRRVHKGLGISEREFYAMVEHLRVILDDMAIDTRSKNQLLAKLAPMKKDVVE